MIWKWSEVMCPVCAVYTEAGVIVVPDLSDAGSLYQDGYGSFQDDHILTLKPFEALYLLERSRIIVLDERDRRGLSFGELLRRFSSEDQLSWTRYLVYRDLRSRGFVVKEGVGEAVDFFVYERGTYPKRPPKYMIHVICEGLPEPISRILEVLKAAEEDNKSLKIAVIDRRGEVVYYTIAELKFKEDEEWGLR
ncbi:tRNA-intron lyase [Candidatus Bathyarchaeota archaeon]|nr:tRNA-intron lyase [Candidatus Bathyarchaeota archaeon]